LKKKKVIKLSLIFLLIIIFFLIIKINFNNNFKLNINETNILTLGYCPTMKEYAENIVLNNPNIKILEVPSSELVFIGLKERNLDIGLTGRLAKSTELNNPEEIYLKTGYTLITKIKSFIDKKDLKQIIIHTALKQDIAEKLLPENTIIYYNNYNEALTGINEAVLINWKDFKDNYELLVVMDGNIKVKDFRIPVLYSINNNLSKLNLNYNYFINNKNDKTS
jgi:hypothetical protein